MSNLLKSQKGIVNADLIVVFVGVIVICATGWYVWRSKQNALSSLNSAQSVNSSKIDTTSFSKTIGYLEVRELGVKVPLTSAIKDAYYTPTIINGKTYYTFSVHSLDSCNDCRATATNPGIAAIDTYVDGQVDALVGDYSKSFPKAPSILGKRYYIMVSKGGCTSSDAIKLASVCSAAELAFDSAYPGIVPL